MNDILNTPSVLRVNALNMRLGWSTPADAFCMMMGTSKYGTAPAMAMDISYNYDEYGKPIVEKMASYPDICDWEYWLTLEPRRGDLDKVIHTSKRIIRVPTVIVCSNFSKMPTKDQKPTAANIKRRDGNRCQYTGVELTNKTFSLDHVVPRHKGGKDTWHNLVAAHKDVNSRKGDKWNHEAGLKLLKRPSAPRSIPLCALYNEIKHPDHAHF